MANTRLDGNGLITPLISTDTIFLEGENLKDLLTSSNIDLPTLSSRWDSDFAENVAWVKSEGNWLNGNAYRDAYDLMVSKIGVNDKFIEAIDGTELTDENADKFLIDTTAVKFRLPLINGERTLVSHLYEETTYGHSSYNLYSDGYCTQEFVFYPNATSGTLTLLRSYKDTKYNVTTAEMGVESESDTLGYDLISAISGFPEKTNETIRFSMGASDHAVNVHTHGMCNVPPISEYNCGNYLFFKLADEVPSTSVNTDQIVTDLKQECDDFKAALEEKFNSGAFVTETWRSENGTDWYRKWSDGWIEQGGFVASDEESGQTERYCNLHPAFTSTNYTVLREINNSAGLTGTIQSYYGGWGTLTKTNTNFSYGYPSMQKRWSMWWYACGY